MKKLALVSILAALPMFVQAADLTLPGEKWEATFDKYICAAFEPGVARPDALETFKVNFENLTTDSTLDNALLKATFEENGQVCRYNAILLADNAAGTSVLVQSIAYAPAITNGAAYQACQAGKAVLDKAFTATQYLYYGHPHNLAFMLPGLNAEVVCGAGKTSVGANFVLKGIIKPAAVN